MVLIYPERFLFRHRLGSVTWPNVSQGYLEEGVDFYNHHQGRPSADSW